MTVLVFRPAPTCFELVEMLNKAKIDALAAPLLSFKAGKSLPSLVNQLHLLPTGSIVVAISPRALEFATQVLKTQNWREDLHYVAIGKKTAQTWKDLFAINAIFPVSESSEGLLNLNIFQHPKGQNILILRGNGGRTLLADKLEQFGAKICYVETYERIWDFHSVVTQSKLWFENKVDKVVITSGEQLDLLWHSASKTIQLRLIQCQLFVPSLRLYQKAKSFGFKVVINVDSATNQALFHALTKILDSENERDKQDSN